MCDSKRLAIFVGNSADVWLKTTTAVILTAFGATLLSCDPDLHIIFPMELQTHVTLIARFIFSAVPSASMQPNIEREKELQENLADIRSLDQQVLRWAFTEVRRCNLLLSAFLPAITSANGPNTLPLPLSLPHKSFLASKTKNNRLCCVRKSCC